MLTTRPLKPQDRAKRQARGQPPGELTCTEIIRNMVLQIVKSCIHVQRNFSENYLRFGHTPSEKFTSPVLGRKKSLKGIGFKGCLTNLHVAPTSQASPNKATCNI
jgi:hypothetical protein